MNGLLQYLQASLRGLTPVAVLDILVVAVFLYQIISIVRGRRAVQVLSGIGTVIMAYVIARYLQLELTRTLFEQLLPYTAFALIVMFQSDIRRFLARIGRYKNLSFGGRLEYQEAAAGIHLAVQQLSQDRTGALIILEREVGLRTFIESGVPMDAQLSTEVLLTIFNKNAPLHDGAVIVQGSRIAAAACFLPITTSPEMSRQYGTRHRAAIGITEEADCIAIIVSEETARISAARGGELEYDISFDRLARLLDLTSVPSLRPGIAAGQHHPSVREV